MKHNLALLGFEVKDVVTGYTGIVTSISFDLYGCVQAIVIPKVGRDGSRPEGNWFDLKRLVATGNKPVMNVPTFDVIPGGQKLPKYPTMPIC